MARRPVIGILYVSAQLYKEKLPDFVNEIEKKYKEMVQRIFSFADIIHSPITYNEQLVEQSIAKFNKSNADGIVIIFASYSPSMIIAPAIKKVNLPVLVWNTQLLYEIDEKFSAKDMMNNHGMHGVQDLACVLLRENVPFSIITGHYNQKDTLSDLEKWCRCVAVYNDLKRLNVGRIGGRFNDMGDFSLPDEIIQKTFGTKIVNFEVSSLEEEARNVEKEELKKIVEENNKFIHEPDVIFEKAACMECILRNLIKRHTLGALAINFMAFEGKGFCDAIPFSAISKLLSEGIGYGGEGDVLSAISVWILQKIADVATFTEMFTTDYKNNRIFMSHMGETNLKMAKDSSQIRLIKKDMSITKTGVSTAMFLFQMKPGDITLFNLTFSEKEKVRMITTTGCVEDVGLFADIKSPHFLLKINNDVREFLTHYSNLGGTHHLAMAYGDFRKELKMFSEISGFEFFSI